jgi:hypothetical protein
MAIRICGLYTLIPISLLLTICFFVLSTVGKIECKKLKNFGLIVATLLMLSAFLILLIGISATIFGKDTVIFPTMRYMMQIKAELIKGMFIPNM